MSVRFETFDPENHTWERYVKRLKNFLLATKVEERLIVPMVITLLGDKTYSVLCDLFEPEDPDNKKAEEIFKRLSEHFSPKILTPVERFHFSERKQREGESINDFILVLRKLSKNCKYGQNLEDRICEQFVYGLLDPEVRTRLLFEGTLTLDLAINLASGVETAKKGAKTFVSPSYHAEEEVLLVKNNDRRPSKQQNYSPQPISWTKCEHCGSNSHDESACRYKDFVCNTCKEIGHLAKVCPSQKQLCPLQKRIGINNAKSQTLKMADRRFTKNDVTNPISEYGEDDAIQYDCFNVTQRQSRKGKSKLSNASINSVVNPCIIKYQYGTIFLRNLRYKSKKVTLSKSVLKKITKYGIKMPP